MDILSLPKIELHCHLDGSLPPEFIRRYLLNRFGESVEDREMMVDPDCHDLAECLKKFDLPLRCLQDRAGLEEAGYQILRQAAAENVRYIETRFAPAQSTAEGLTMREVIRAVLDGMERGNVFGVKWGVLLCAMRGRPEEENRQMLEAGREFLGAGVVGADLAGDEARYPMAEYKKLFTDAIAMGYPLTLHAGECGSVENIREAAQIGARRIGHGVAMAGHPEVQRLCREKSIGIELCPTSNFQTRAVRAPEAYPLREFLDAGLLVTVSTDNRTVSGCSLTGELTLAREKLGVTDRELVQMQENAVRASFADTETKEALLKELKGWAE